MCTRARRYTMYTYLKKKPYLNTSPSNITIDSQAQCYLLDTFPFSVTWSMWTWQCRVSGRADSSSHSSHIRDFITTSCELSTLHISRMNPRSSSLHCSSVNSNVKSHLSFSPLLLLGHAGITSPLLLTSAGILTSYMMSFNLYSRPLTTKQCLHMQPLITGCMNWEFFSFHSNDFFFRLKEVKSIQ